MRLSLKYRLYPNCAQAKFLLSELQEACSLYNAALEERIGAWRVCRKSLNYYDQANQLRAMRADGCLTLANYSCCQDVLRRVEKTFKAFFARVKCGAKPGFPRFKSIRRYDSITFPQYGNGCKLREKMLYIQGTGEIKIKLHRIVKGQIKTVCIKREAGRWFAIFSVEAETQPLPVSDLETGIDVGLNSFAVLADGTEIANPRYYREAEAWLRRAQRKVARRKKGSHRRHKAVRELQGAHAYVQNQRRDFLHKQSRRLVDEHGMIAVEDLNVKGLARTNLAKSVYDAGWSTFLAMLAYKAENAGRRLLRVDPRGTSQTCLCGANVAKTLRDRWHDCSACGLSASRDHVSAQLILSRARNGLSRLNVENVVSCVPRRTVG